MLLLLMMMMVVLGQWLDALCDGGRERRRHRFERRYLICRLVWGIICILIRWRVLLLAIVLLLRNLGTQLPLGEDRWVVGWVWVLATVLGDAEVGANATFFVAFIGCCGCMWDWWLEGCCWCKVAATVSDAAAAAEEAGGSGGRGWNGWIFGWEEDSLTACMVFCACMGVGSSDEMSILIGSFYVFWLYGSYS